MQIYPSMSPLQLGGKQGSAVALGYFDGIHIGHRTVICGAVDWAQAHGAAAALFTFKLPGGSKIKGRRLYSVEDKRRTSRAGTRSAASWRGLGWTTTWCPPLPISWP